MTPTLDTHALIAATRRFAAEQRGRSWWCLLSTFGALGASVALAAAAPTWPLRLGAAVLEALVLVRAFVLFHDHMHGALLRGSRLAAGIFGAFGTLILTPPRVWRDTHNHHHAHTAQLSAPSAGTFALLTTEAWRAASWRRRLAYRTERHPLTVLLAYATVFFGSLCVGSFVRGPRRYWSSGLAVLVHLALSAAVFTAFGFGVYAATMLLPLGLAYALGAYLFYAQHNFAGARVRPGTGWSYASAALEASSYLRCGPVMAWFTGNIGYHHVHHLNSRIPFYRLPEAMRAMPELQSPGTTSLSPADVARNFRLNLWDTASGRMVSFAAAR